MYEGGGVCAIGAGGGGLDLKRSYEMGLNGDLLDSVRN